MFSPATSGFGILEVIRGSLFYQVYADRAIQKMGICMMSVELYMLIVEHTIWLTFPSLFSKVDPRSLIVYQDDLKIWTLLSYDVVSSSYYGDLIFLWESHLENLEKLVETLMGLFYAISIGSVLWLFDINVLAYHVIVYC